MRLKSQGGWEQGRVVSHSSAGGFGGIMTAGEVLSREAKEGVEAGVLGTSQPHIPFLLPHAGVNR